MIRRSPFLQLKANYIGGIIFMRNIMPPHEIKTLKLNEEATKV